MAAYAARHGDRLPDRDAAIPAKTLVMKYLCRELWKLLPAFDDVDADRSGFLDRDEVKRTYVAALMAVHDDGAPECEAEKIAAENMVDQLIACLDTNSDGKIDAREWESAIEVALAKTFGDGGSERGDGDVVLAPAAVDRARRADAWTFGESARVPAVDFDSAGSAVADFNAVEDASSPVPLALDEGAPEATPPTSPGILVIRADDPSPESE